MESGKKDEKSRFDDDDTDSDCQLNSHLDNEDKGKYYMYINYYYIFKY